MVRVVVTRPQPGASRTAARLRKLGLEPILIPLSETKALDIDIQSLPADIAAAAVTSSNAIRHASAELIQRLAGLPCHVVGLKTADAARSAGLSVAEIGQGDAEALADRIAPSLAGKTVVYLCGHVRFSAFETGLSAKNVNVVPLEIYDTLAIHQAGVVVMKRLAGRPADAVLLYSAKAAQAFSELARRPELARYFDETRILVLSERVASSFGPVAPGRLVVAGEPNEDALLALLDPAD